MYGMDVFMLKNSTTSAPDTREQPYVYEWGLIFPQITFWRYKHESAMLLDPGHNRGYMGNVFQLKRTWRLWTIQLMLIVAVVEVFLHEDSFHF